ncbi:hypothetical protein J437_LFUL008889, partial [Ladona fulva]
ETRLSYTIQYKLGVLNYAKVHGNRAAARSTTYQKMIRTSRLQEDQLKTAKKKKHNLRCPAPSWPELENAIKMWVIDKRNSGISVSTKMIINEAKEFAEKQGNQNFSRSEGWCYRFMKRHGLSMCTKITIAQEMPADYEEKILVFHRFVINARKKTSFELGQIGNMDEIPFIFDVPSNNTEAHRTETIKNKVRELKTQIAVIPGGLTCQLQPLDVSVNKPFKQKVFMKRHGLSMCTKITIAQEMPADYEEKILVFHRFVINARKKTSFELGQIGNMDEIPFIFDVPSNNTEAHRTETIKNKVRELKTQIAVIPGGLTCQLQPLDVSVNKPFKQKV